MFRSDLESQYLASLTMRIKKGRLTRQLGILERQSFNAVRTILSSHVTLIMACSLNT